MKIIPGTEEDIKPLPSGNLDSDECSRIPISFITSVQPHGYLLVLNRADLTICQVSGNFSDSLGLQTPEVLGKPLGHYVMAQALEEIKKNAFAAETGSNIPFNLWFSTPRKTVNYLALLHLQPDYLLLELEEQQPKEAAPSFVNVYQQVKQVLTKLASSGSTTEMLQVAAEEIKKLSGFDRVMLYSFDPDWNGTVMGESLEDGMEPYLGLRFPASDIPKQARELYLRTPYRCIPDSSYQPVPLVPELNPLTSQPTNLSDCLLRGVPPVHLEYLQNMEVGSSMSASVIKDGQLWGLISCHHRQPKFLPYELRSAFELLANIISAELSVRESHSVLRHRNELSDKQVKLLELMAKENDFAKGLTAHTPNVLDFLDLSGVVILFENSLTTKGQVPSEEQTQALIQWLAEQKIQQIFITDRLPAVYPPAREFQETASGLLALPLSKGGNAWLLGFRAEVLQQVNWGGNPNDHVRVTEEKGKRRLHPRNSFTQWKEIVSGTSISWKDYEKEAALNLRNSLLEVILKVQTLKRLIAEEEVYKLSVVAAKTDNAVVILGRNGIVEWLNQAFSKITGLNLAEASGKNLLELATTVRAQEQVAELLSQARYHSGSFSKDMSIERDNKQYYINFSFTPFSSPVTDQEHLIGIGLDVTTMRQYSEQLESVNRELDKFTAIVAHDLKAPLASLHTLATALEENIRREKHSDSLELLDYMKRSVKKMGDLINDLLTYSRIGRVNMLNEQLDLRQLLTEVIEWLHPHENISIELPSELPMLKGVKMNLQQIFSNLLGNAIKYGCSETDCQIKVGYENLAEFHQFSITDFGQGIHQKHHSRIFEMFHALPTGPDKSAGTGIGLATVKKLVEEAGGKIWVESEPDSGAVFYFTLPASEETES